MHANSSTAMPSSVSKAPKKRLKRVASMRIDNGPVY
jgi:hypothetical protein